jgi:hypothetical protein
MENNEKEKPIYGTIQSVDFKQGICTFKIGNNFSIAAGTYTILSQSYYVSICENLLDLQLQNAQLKVDNTDLLEALKRAIGYVSYAEKEVFEKIIYHAEKGGRHE